MYKWQAHLSHTFGTSSFAPHRLFDLTQGVAMPTFLSRLGLSEHSFVACLRTTLIAVAAIGLITSSAFAIEPEKITQDDQAKSIPGKPTDEWKIQIVPGQSNPVASVPRVTQVSHNDAEKFAIPTIEEPATSVRRNEPQVLNSEAYREIYNSIPFSRTEYLANRDYRHETTMEILFGQLRPKTVVKLASPISERRLSYSHQWLGRPGEIAPPFWRQPMLWNHWMR